MKIGRVFDAVTGLPGDVAEEVKDAVFAVKKIPAVVAQLVEIKKDVLDLSTDIEELIRILERKREDG